MALKLLSEPMNIPTGVRAADRMYTGSGAIAVTVSSKIEKQSESVR